MPHLLVCLCLAFFGDWTEFRGPNADGHAPESKTPVEWSDTTNITWKCPVPGLGWSSPVIENGMIYLTTAVPVDNGLSLRVISMDATKGEVVWDTEVRRIDTVPGIHPKNSHASPTPIVSKNAIYVHFGAMGTARLKKNGQVEWLNSELVYPHVHGSGGSPALFDEKLYILCDGSSQPFVVALSAADGKIVWKTQRSLKGPISHSFGTPRVIVHDGTAQLLAPGPDHMAAYDVHSGKELWRVKAPGWSVVPQPVVGHGMVFYNHDYDHPELLAVRLGGSGDITDSHIAWRIQRGAPSTPTPVLVGDELYFVSDKGIASCVDARSGKQHWMERLGGNFSASPVYANGMILFMDEDGHAFWVKPSKTFELAGRSTVTGRTFATPAFADGAMYLRTDSAVLKIAN